jgi:hypothetical protein
MSVALEEWRGTSARALDEIESLHRLAEGAWQHGSALTEQITYVYAALILAHFQRYCRGAHTEATKALVEAMPLPGLAVVLEDLLTEGRHLDRGNPTPTNLGRDFGRFGFNFWEAIEADDRHNGTCRRELDRLCDWRNGVVHGDIPGKRASGRLVPSDLSLDACRGWRRAVGALVISIDRAVAKQCQSLGCPRPW